VFDLKLQSPARIFRAATHGLGVFEISVPAPETVSFIADSITLPDCSLKYREQAVFSWSVASLARPNRRDRSN
jgi:hypothetical protein